MDDWLTAATAILVQTQRDHWRGLSVGPHSRVRIRGVPRHSLFEVERSLAVAAGSYDAGPPERSEYEVVAESLESDARWLVDYAVNHWEWIAAVTSPVALAKVLQSVNKLPGELGKLPQTVKSLYAQLFGWAKKFKNVCLPDEVITYAVLEDLHARLEPGTWQVDPLDAERMRIWQPLGDESDDGGRIIRVLEEKRNLWFWYCYHAGELRLIEPIQDHERSASPRDFLLAERDDEE